MLTSKLHNQQERFSTISTRGTDDPTWNISKLSCRLNNHTVSLSLTKNNARPVSLSCTRHAMSCKSPINHRAQLWNSKPVSAMANLPSQLLVRLLFLYLIISVRVLLVLFTDYLRANILLPCMTVELNLILVTCILCLRLWLYTVTAVSYFLTAWYN